MSFNLSDYMTNREKERLGIATNADPKPISKLTPGRDFMKPITKDGKVAFQFYFKGRYATFFVVGQRETTRDGKLGELFTLNRGSRAAIDYEAFRPFGGELVFIGEAKDQIVDPQTRTREMIRASKFN